MLIPNPGPSLTDSSLAGFMNAHKRRFEHDVVTDPCDIFFGVEPFCDKGRMGETVAYLIQLNRYNQKGIYFGVTH